MRIVHVVQRYHPALGGAETHVREVAEEQARRGHDVLVATSAMPGAAESETQGGVRIRRFPARTHRGDYLLPPWLPMDGLLPFLVHSRADILHAHSYRFSTVEAAAAAHRREGIPLVVTAHGFYPPENPLVALARWRYDRARGRRALAAASRCVAVTSHEVAHYAALGVDPQRVDVVPNGIPTRALEPGDGAAFRAKHALGDGPIVLFLARLAHDKGLGDLVRAAPRFLAAHPDATLVVCGRDAGAGTAARRDARRRGLDGRIRFLGSVDDPRDAYAACDVFVLPSHYEAFGLVLLEAMAQGRPVVATTAGGMPEVVAEAGVLVRPRAPRELGDAIGALLADAPRRRALAEAASARARTFLWTDIVPRLEETYERARG